MNCVLVKTLILNCFDFCKFKSLVECVFMVVITSLLAIVPSRYLRHPMDRDPANYTRLVRLLKNKLILRYLKKLIVTASTAKSKMASFLYRLKIVSLYLTDLEYNNTRYGTSDSISR